ncbi:hypothetical protein [Microlunatus spumicola]|uniref:hypothetical protein n=1 Tax=Microlunatus spumicola TaxID=81499 RepID=UPI00195BDA81
MRSPVLLLCLALVGGGAATGCALVGDPCDAPLTGTATYVSGSTPPPYHHEWTVRLDATSGTVTWSPGYGSTEAWSATFVPDPDRFARACRDLRDRADEETAAGGGTLTVAWTGDSGRRTRLTTSDAQAAEVVRAAVPAPAWAEAQGAYERWQQAQRR